MTALRSEASQLYPFVRRGRIDVSGGHHDAGDYSKYTTNSAGMASTPAKAATMLQFSLLTDMDSPVT